MKGGQSRRADAAPGAAHRRRPLESCGRPAVAAYGSRHLRPGIYHRRRGSCRAAPRSPLPSSSPGYDGQLLGRVAIVIRSAFPSARPPPLRPPQPPPIALRRAPAGDPPAASGRQGACRGSACPRHYLPGAPSAVAARPPSPPSPPPSPSALPSAPSSLQRRPRLHRLRHPFLSRRHRRKQMLAHASAPMVLGRRRARRQAARARTHLKDCARPYRTGRCASATLRSEVVSATVVDGCRAYEARRGSASSTMRPGGGGQIGGRGGRASKATAILMAVLRRMEGMPDVGGGGAKMAEFFDDIR